MSFRLFRRCKAVLLLSGLVCLIALLWWPHAARSVPAWIGLESAPGPQVQIEANNKPSYQRVVVDLNAPDLRLTDQHASSLRLSELLESKAIVALNFIFTACPTVCPIYSAVFAEAKRSAKLDSDEVQFISISIDPANDTPGQLANYAARFRAGANWAFLTGGLDQVHATQRAFEVYRGEKMNHPQALFLHHKDSKSWVRLEGMVSAEALVSEIIALRECATCE